MSASNADKHARMCPICSRVMEASLCPDDAIATLLVNPPQIDASRVEPGTLIGGRYVIEELVGKGGFGSVFRSRHTGTGQQIALKCLSTQGEHDEVHLKRFFQEARVTAGLKHPNTIRVFDFGQDDSGLIYLAMELLSGRTLKQELRARREDDRVFTQNEAIGIGIGICKSLAEAHKAGLVHRDLKPDNVFLHRVDEDDEDEPPVVKVLDFGIVKFANSTLTLGSDSGVPGTPAYMSPEQVVKRDLDGRSDLYSLGVILYQLVSGKVPLRGESMMQTLYMHVHEDPPSLKPRVRTPVTVDFCRLVHAALEKNPENRPGSAQQMREALELMFEGDFRSSGDSIPRISRASVPVLRPPSNETLTSPGRLQPQAAPEPRLFSSPGVEAEPNDISIADLPSRRDVFEKRTKRSVPWWVYGGLLVTIGVLVGIVMVLLAEPPKVTMKPAVVGKPLPPPAAPAKAEPEPEPEPEPEVVAPKPAPKIDKPTKKPRRIKRRQRPTRAKPAPAEEEPDKYEVLDQKI